jgi:hypothetical protein
VDDALRSRYAAASLMAQRGSAGNDRSSHDPAIFLRTYVRLPICPAGALTGAGSSPRGEPQRRELTDKPSGEDLGDLPMSLSRVRFSLLNPVRVTQVRGVPDRRKPYSAWSGG